MDNEKTGLTFAQLSRANRSRAERWHKGDIDTWTLADWAVALAGETGELCNIVKKLKRAEDGIVGNTVFPRELHLQLADEIADVAIYLDLVAQRAGLSLADAIQYKFNVVSERHGFPERLP